jgi:exodeoxyribonuclease V alpha subunit
MEKITERISGIVQRVTYHNPDNGWSVLRVAPFHNPGRVETVTVHQTRVFAGATMEFHGSWVVHSRFGRQFQAEKAIEKKPASAAALEKYLGSGLIKGVGPKTAQRIVNYFREKTLDVFENDIDRLTEVPGIAKKKLAMIKEAWREHRMVREVMMFLQGHGISTLFAVRIFKKYGEKAIEFVREDPYRLAADFYGIGFFSADRVALSIGLAPDSPERIVAAIRHILASSREQGHCYLTIGQIGRDAEKLLDFSLGDRLLDILKGMERDNQLRVRLFADETGKKQRCYYSRTLYYDEEYVADRIRSMTSRPMLLPGTFSAWIKRYCSGAAGPALSEEQVETVRIVVCSHFSVLTGGPGCGKTTTTLVIVRFLETLGKKVLLAAPTGRAAQRMGEVIGREAKTLHRLLEFQNGGFKRNEEQPLRGDFLIVDECSMLDISLTASLFRAVPKGCQLLFIGDADQLPSVGPGNVLRDILASAVVPSCRLTRVFRQARQSKIIEYAHQINGGEIPRIASPFKNPTLWQKKTDCIFLDSDEATREQLGFIARVKRDFMLKIEEFEGLGSEDDLYIFRTNEKIASAWEKDFEIPEKFRHVDLQKIRQANGAVEELKAVMAKIHPWSSLNYGLGGVDTVVRLYTDWIPKYMGKDTEIQILSPMTRGSMGTANLNRVIQEAVNPAMEGRAQLQVGERIFREGDRVIHRRNNYDLAVFNGDIGRIISIDNAALTCVVAFAQDGRRVLYRRDDILELDLAYAITIHKSQGSEFQAVILPVLTQHFKMLFRNLIYTGLTRARSMAAFVGTRKALAMAVRRQDSSRRQTGLETLLRSQMSD